MPSLRLFHNENMAVIMSVSAVAAYCVIVLNFHGYFAMTINPYGCGVFLTHL